MRVLKDVATAPLDGSWVQRNSGLQGQHTPGKHVRHIIDHYQAFLRGIGAALINYEHRPREEVLETQPDIACRRLRAVCQSLVLLTGNSHQSPVLLDYPPGMKPLNVHSRVGRELVFLSSHTIHHMAIIGLLAEQLGVQSETTFGVHPSTLRYWQRPGANVTETA